ncbi:MAG: Holliday junction resolvase RuvX [Dehalococcoidia bacterium]|nr:Holliday junction resolvase RuvX [Dehalococcoidia bacterium]
MTRILALDLGQRRIGLAVGDTEGRLAAPVGALSRYGVTRDVPAVQEQARKQGAESILVGVPYNMDGSVGPRARSALAFCDALRQASALPVVPWDERLSTVQAEQMLRASGAQPSRDRARLDAASAAVILQSYLDTRRTPPAP